MFNLLPYVERKRVLSLTWMVRILVAYMVVLLLISLGIYVHDNQLKRAVTELNQSIEQSKRALQTRLSQQTLVAVLPSSGFGLDQQGFFPAFNDISRLQLDNLWLTRLTIDRQVPVIRFEGVMRSSNILSDFLAFLAQTPTFKNERFVGLNVQQAKLPKIPDQYKANIAALQLPTFYRFVAQTMPLNGEKNP